MLSNVRKICSYIINKINAEICLLALISLFFIQVVFAFYSHETAALFTEIFLLCLIPVCAILFCRKDYAIRIQMLGINTFFLFIWVAGIFCDVSSKNYEPLVLGGILCLVAGFILNLWFLRKDLLQRLISKKNIYLMLVCIIYFTLSFETLRDIPIYDSGAYYSWSISKLAPTFNFTLNNIFDYCLAGHISVGYGLFALLGELISPFTAMGVHLVNILLAILSIIAFFKILEHIFPDYAAEVIGMASAVYAFSPYVLGMAGIINIDNPGIYVFVIMLYCHIRKYRMWELFWAWIFVCTKEPHVIYYAFYVIGIILGELRDSRHRENKVSFVERIKRFVIPQIYRGIPLICWFVYYIAPGRNSWVASSEGIFNNRGLHTIGFTLENTVGKVKELLVLNFNWIFVVAILIYVIAKCHLQRNDNRKLINRLILWCLAGVLIFNLFYIDYLHPRYFALGAEIIVLLGIIALLSIKGLKNYHIFILPIIIFLVIVQSYTTIDPLTRLCYQSINYVEPTKGLITTSGAERLDDSAIYNREYSYYTRALEETLNQIEYDDNTVLVFFEYENIPRIYGYSHRFLWNCEEKVIQTNETENTIPIHIALEEEELNGYERIVYVEPCFFRNGDVPFEQTKGLEELIISYRTMIINVKIFAGMN